MAITVDRLINDERFSGDNVAPFLLYLPFGLVLLAVRTIFALVLWIASIMLPDKSSVRQLLSVFACFTFGVYVKVKGKKDPKCSILVANYVSVLDSLAASHTLGTISLRKWKVPPFFAASLGIRNAAQFVRKQHFADSLSKPVLLQPEGGPTNGQGLLKFVDWPFQIGNKVQPVTICVERSFTNVTVHQASDSAERFPWSDALWYLWSPVTVYRLELLPAMERADDEEEQAFVLRVRAAIARALDVETTECTWRDVNIGSSRVRRSQPDMQRLAAQVRTVLPRVPMADIMRDLAQTRSVDITITNFLEGITPYTPEPETTSHSEPSTSQAPAPKYIIPVPTGTFPKNAKERQLSFQERKAQMIAEARQRYIEKHGLVIQGNC